MAANPQKPAATAGRKGKGGHIRPTKEKRDDDIMNTNDSSIVSKRSVSKLYLPNEPDFYEPVTQKFVRRNPLINRGYWLRMHAIEQVVLQFLQKDEKKPKIIVNLGCGYDPLPFQFWHRYASKCENVTFVDVDYPQLIQRKWDRILEDDLLREPLIRANLRSCPSPVYLRSDKYMALGCDLRDLKTLGDTLSTEFDLTASSILFVGEVSITYMPVQDANALIAWASNFEDAKFCLLEQYLPQGPHHPFAQTMLRHFKKLQTTIYAVKDYPSLALQKTRFTGSGWAECNIRNLWDLWSDETFTPPEVRTALDTVEPFDEWEEFALFAGHYFLAVASNKAAGGQEGVHAGPDTVVQPADRPTSTRTIVLTSHVPHPEQTLTARRFGAGFALDSDSVVLHGGQGVQHRLTSIEVLGRRHSEVVIPSLPTPQARICHSITTLGPNAALLVGGRTSPSHALASCWYLQDQQWQAVHELHPARFRHCSAKVKIPGPESEVISALVFGGKTSDGSVLNDAAIWTPEDGWSTIAVDGTIRPPPRFGAAMCSMGHMEDRGFIVGGMTAEGTVLQDIWEYRISRGPEIVISYKDRSQDVLQSPASSLTYGRFGATLAPFGDSFLLIGGVARKELVELADEFLHLTVGEQIEIKPADVSIPENVWPLLVGSVTVPLSDNELVIAGGGAVCFSMGSFWNEGFLILRAKETPESSPWSVSTVTSAVDTQCAPDAKSDGKSGNKEQSKNKGKQSSKGKGKGKPKGSQSHLPKPKTVPRIQVRSADEFGKVLKESKPVILEQLDLGPCQTLWTLEYLKDKLGPQREVVIHECSADRMTFRDKNFQYVTKPFGDFLDGIADGQQTYLRAVSASQPNKLPTKLEDDFPEIAADFQLPPALKDLILEGYHSSPLRISGAVSLWLHYDVLANVLCQIKGTKTLRLYPPSDVRHLDYPPGGSSSNTNVFDSQEPSLRHTQPYTALLRPGDVLYIPPMWSHTATPEEGYSVAVNVFFKNLSKGYAAGKDVYGNRDLQAYENGRRDVEKIIRAFREIPNDMARFYLDRLAMELQDKADSLARSGQ
ncbi:LCM-domain-containing protein [Sporormia fimetaria CBS 119925]|uniref:tRNA wybutosine-synthesizing protein 4 n=1 Tax=Sporormia fimetaria CBS 119925 TaxID=1340428 RepID=A0A6A6V2Z6_9PLEO|nr:LCM-domain-containing protein [Sporormia fimetaria CBS 119925]